MAQNDPRPGEKYMHFKNRLYQVIAVAYHSETMERYVVYQALYGDFRTYVRPYEMFVSEVDHEKYPNVKQKYRFRLVEDASGAAPENEKKEAVPAEMKYEEMSAGETEAPEAASEQKQANVMTGAVSERVNHVSDDADQAGESGAQHQNRDELGAEAGTEQNDCSPEGEAHLNPWLDKILDADTFEEKYKIVCDMQSDVTDRLIDDIAVVMDLVIPEGNLRERYAQLKYCIRTKQRYETGRLR